MTISNFWLIRHGETQWNSEMRLQGWRDIPLNKKGNEQARQLKKHLESNQFNVNIDAVISSDLSRAWQTAEISTSHFGLPVIKTPTLRERNYGIYEGHNLIIRQGQRAGLPDFDLRDPHANLKEGENLTVFHNRIKSAFEELAQTYRGQNIMVFAHGGVIDSVWRLSQQLGLDVFREHAILNTSINEFNINIQNESWSLVNWGQIYHLNESSISKSTLP